MKNGGGFQQIESKPGVLLQRHSPRRNKNSLHLGFKPRHWPVIHAHALQDSQKGLEISATIILYIQHLSHSASPFRLFADLCCLTADD